MRADREVMQAASALIEASAGKGAEKRGSCEGRTSACGCFEQAAKAALDANLGQRVLDHLDSAKKHCGPTSVAGGLEAEATVRVGRLQEGQLLALEARKVHPNDPYAAYALALASAQEGTLKETEEKAQKAVELGRGPEVARTLGRLAVSRGDFAAARGQFLQLQKAFPHDTEALFSLGISEGNLKNYNASRKAFLGVLAIEPRHFEARKHLVLLTAQAGALFECRHHLAELQKLAPGAPEVAGLKRALDELERGRETPTTENALQQPP
jgi:tetratricopeptide (TPR) repeat protein